nr:LysR family transcriptional regulator [Streptomyces acidiscabies]
MDPHLLRTFVAVARLASFSEAARELGYTQSAVSQHIAALEQDLGAPLLTRRPVTPTPAGDRLLEHAKPLLLRLDAARADVARIAAAPAYGLTLAASPAALGARLEAERRVTADIAHELRTPVAGMSTAVGLLPPGRPSELIADSVGRLRGLVEDVLEVARMDAQVAAVEKEQREVSAMARRAVAGLAGVTVEIVTDAAVATDPRRVERILTNLAANALRHGRAPVLVTVEGAVIRVRDRGDGFPADLLAILHASGPQRFRTGGRTGGTGLGLTIATGQARLLGAQLTFRNHPGGGAEAELRLPVGEGGGVGRGVRVEGSALVEGGAVVSGCALVQRLARPPVPFRLVLDQHRQQ